MSSPPAKRQRAENAPITRSDTWFSDGNVVLQADNTQFRVHWGVLALHSSVFSDMQGLPQPPDQPTVEGCAVVELQDDPEDVELMLKALYSLKFHCQKRLPLPAVGAFLRLGRKYDIQDLFDSAVARLTSEFPTTLEGHDRICFENLETIEATYDNAIFDLISIASDNNISTALPCAYLYVVNYCSVDEIFDGFSKGRNNDPIHLRRCIAAQTNLSIKQFKPGFTLSWIRSWEFDDSHCENTSKCYSRRSRMFSSCVLSGFLGFVELKDLMQPDSVALCPVCTRLADGATRNGREKLWAELPGDFGLAPWAELRND
ncbi:BTB domain-containing protein [Favolaschia claudopus]|uniref:BTB domain-containing protein n=1 Tax=Favolaschia claudopus TaxID=2862362 RepID=A0AAW0BH12_9AGAR